MPKWTIFLISSKVNNSQSKEFVLITEIFWRIFWRDNWRSLIVFVENFRYWHSNWWGQRFWLWRYHTVTESADFGFIPLLWRPQGPKGCLEKQNYPLSLNLVVWCAKIGPKTKKLQKTCQNTIIFDNSFVNSEVFQTFLVLGSILVHQTTKF